MRAKHTTTAGEYATALDADPREYDRLIRSLTVNVTKFFRNWDTYSTIKDKIIPALWERREPETRVWSAGCSSGEEPYSIGILMHKHATERNEDARLENIKIVGTDIDTECLANAERACYANSALGDTPPALRAQYFPEVEETHLILCRNVIIYFERAAQDALFAAFHRALAPGGFLVLGKVESLLGEARSLFSPVNARERIFRKI